MAVTFAAPAAASTLAVVPYRVLIGDHRTRRIFAEMPAAELGYTDELNVPGSCAFKLPLEHPAVTRDVVWAGNRTVFVERAGTVVWGGFIKTCRADATTVSVAAEGWWAYLRRRFMRGPHVWSNHDQLAIARQIMTILRENDSYAMPDVDPNPASSGVLRAVTWTGYDKSGAAQIEELMAMEKGFDVEFTFPWTAGWPVPTLHFRYPYRGQRQPVPLDTALPVVDVAVEVDASDVSSIVNFFGKDNPQYPDQPWTDRQAVSYSTAAQLGHPTSDEINAARDLETLAELQALANKRAQKVGDTIPRPQITVATGGGGELEAVGTGDTIHVVYERGWADIDGWYRIMARQVTVGDDGTETTKFDLAPYSLAGGP